MRGPREGTILLPPVRAEGVSVRPGTTRSGANRIVDPRDGHRRRVERVNGVEPSWLGWEPRALPLSYTRMDWRGRRAMIPQPRRWQRRALPIELRPHGVVGAG